MFSLIGNVIVLNTYGRDLTIENDMPKWVKYLLILYFINFYNNNNYYY
jgi:hypothetical protein